MIIANTLFVELETDISKEEFDLCIEAPKETIDLGLELAFNVTPIEGDEYEGLYEVSPSFDPQELPTKNKILTDYLTVNAIEVSRVTNPQGGQTVYIGGIINA